MSSRPSLPPLDGAHVLIAGTVRDCSETLGETVNALSRAFASAGRIDWLVIESDSNDQTIQRLEGLSARDPHFRFHSLGPLSDRFPERTTRIAHCRNRISQSVRTDPDLSGVDFVVLADFDGVNASIRPESIASSWVRGDWDACFANQSDRYYDIWALRHPDWSPNDCWRAADFLDDFMSRRKAEAAAVFSRMIRIEPDRDWIEVHSAFGGLGIYRREAFVAGTYVGLDPDGREVCEHVAFHQDLVQAGFRLFVNPALINGCRNEHSDLGARQRKMIADKIKWTGRRIRHRISRTLKAISPISR